MSIKVGASKRSRGVPTKVTPDSRYKAHVKMDRRTKDLVKRLGPGDIALIDHEDVDRVCAEGLIKSDVGVVLNAGATITGRYPNPGPALLVEAGILVIDLIGEGIFESLRDGDEVTVSGAQVYRAGDVIATGRLLTKEIVEQRLLEAEENLSSELEAFAKNTLEYLHKEKTHLLQLVEVPDVKIEIADRHALVVVRGHNYKDDLRTLRAYLRDMKPVLIAVDGGADALIEQGFKPHIIVGDMDSVSDQALRCGAELIVHGYPDGRAPGKDRLEELGLTYQIFPAPATSEDIALLLAYEHGAELIVAVGTHINLVDFLDKGRQGMASTFLTRLKVGTRFIDAKGVSEIYQSRVPVSHLSALLLAGMTTFVLIILVASPIRHLVTLLAMRARLAIGI